MRLKDLFTVPTGQKVTEKTLHRVLISSICSILLCMGCLASTTWAWFAVGIENTGNVIQIADWKLDVKIMKSAGSGGSTDADLATELSPGANEEYILDSGNYSVSISFEPTASPNAFGDNRTVYVVMREKKSDSLEKMYYVKLTMTQKGETNQYSGSYQLDYPANGATTLSFYVTWAEPCGEGYELWTSFAEEDLSATADAVQTEILTEAPTDAATELSTDNETNTTVESSADDAAEDTDDSDIELSTDDETETTESAAASSTESAADTSEMNDETA